MSCCKCYNAILSNCNEGIRLKAGLTPGDDYKWIITDKFGNKYNDTVQADYLGDIIIDESILPTGFFTPFSGEFELQIVNPITNLPVTLTICAYYECVNISIVGGSDVEDTIGQ